MVSNALYNKHFDKSIGHGASRPVEGNSISTGGGRFEESRIDHDLPRGHVAKGAAGGSAGQAASAKPMSKPSPAKGNAAKVKGAIKSGVITPNLTIPQ